MAAPESSPFEMKPRAPLPATSGPKSEESRLEVRTTTGAPLLAVIRARDGEAVEVGEVDVEEHEVGVQLVRPARSRSAVRRLADDVVALGLEQHSCRRAEGRVVVDDEDGRHHWFKCRTSGDCPVYG